MRLEDILDFAAAIKVAFKQHLEPRKFILKIDWNSYQHINDTLTLFDTKLRLLSAADQANLNTRLARHSSDRLWLTDLPLPDHSYTEYRNLFGEDLLTRVFHVLHYYLEPPTNILTINSVLNKISAVVKHYCILLTQCLNDSPIPTRPIEQLLPTIPGLNNFMPTTLYSSLELTPRIAQAQPPSATLDLLPDVPEETPTDPSNFNFSPQSQPHFSPPSTSPPTLPLSTKTKPKYLCHLCRKSFVTKYELDQHIPKCAIQSLPKIT